MYSILTNQNKSLNIRSLFGRMLRQLPGGSVAKATTVIHFHPTISSLISRLNSFSSMENALNYLLKLEVKGSSDAAKVAQKLGPQYSRVLVALYCSENYEVWKLESKYFKSRSRSK